MTGYEERLTISHPNLGTEIATVYRLAKKEIENYGWVQGQAYHYPRPNSRPKRCMDSAVYHNALGAPYRFEIENGAMSMVGYQSVSRFFLNWFIHYRKNIGIGMNSVTIHFNDLDNTKVEDVLQMLDDAADYVETLKPHEIHSPLLHLSREETVLDNLY